MPLDRIVTFLLTENPDAALTFYRDTLGLPFLRDDGFALVFRSGETMLRIGKVPSHTPAQHTVLGWEMQDIAAAVAELAAKGVAFQYYPGRAGNLYFPQRRQSGLVQGSGWQCTVALAARAGGMRGAAGWK
jgi:catechol 2,3-dioxygenase-like lactoylglutathione lyase family enzyme